MVLGNNRRASILKKSVLALAVASVAPSLFGTHDAQAASFTWDSDGAAGVFGQDGPGNWNNALQNFTDGISNFAWSNTTNAGDTAVFGNTANGGVVTLTAPIIA